MASWYFREPDICLCGRCSSEADVEQENYEDTSMFCDDCGDRIESLYCEDCVVLAGLLRDAEVDDADPEWFVGWDAHSEVGSICTGGRHIDSVVTSGGVIVEVARGDVVNVPYAMLAALPRWDADRRMRRRRAFVGLSRFDEMPEDVEEAALEYANDRWGGGWRVLTVVETEEPEED